MHPTRGAAQSVKSMFSGKHEPTGVLASPRLSLAKEAASRLPTSEKDAMMGRLRQLEKEAKNRVKEREGNRVFLLANQREREEERVARNREREERKARKALQKVKDQMKVEKGDFSVEAGNEDGVVVVEDKKGKKGKKEKGKGKKDKGKGKKEETPADVAEGPLSQTTTRDGTSAIPAGRRFSSVFGVRRNNSMEKGRLVADEPAQSTQSIPDTSTQHGDASNDATSTAPPSWRTNSAFGVPRADAMAEGRLWRAGSASEASATSGPSTSAPSWRTGSALGIPTIQEKQ